MAGSIPSDTTRRAAQSAFTRADLLITHGALALLALVVLPAAPRSGYQRLAASLLYF